MTSYDVEWVPGMGEALAQKLATLLTRRAEKGWRPHSIVPAQSGAIYGALVVLEKT